MLFFIFLFEKKEVVDICKGIIFFVKLGKFQGGDICYLYDLRVL